MLSCLRDSRFDSGGEVNGIDWSFHGLYIYPDLLGPAGLKSRFWKRWANKL